MLVIISDRNAGPSISDWVEQESGAVLYTGEPETGAGYYQHAIQTDRIAGQLSLLTSEQYEYLMTLLIILDIIVIGQYNSLFLDWNFQYFPELDQMGT